MFFLSEIIAFVYCSCDQIDLIPYIKVECNKHKNVKEHKWYRYSQVNFVISNLQFKNAFSQFYSNTGQYRSSIQFLKQSWISVQSSVGEEYFVALSYNIEATYGRANFQMRWTRMANVPLSHPILNETDFLNVDQI